MTTSQKKRLFEEICEHIQKPTIQKRPHLDSIYFKCPECRARPLTPCNTGVCCPNCNLTITLDCADLTCNAVDRMMRMVRSQHSGCFPVTGIEASSSSSSSNKAASLVLPDGQVYLSWTCPGCNQLEILL
ncbi:hypothetical protein BDB00DRAFT_855668 [Zychaea mexicana]|uniref:uncharacterized protein n=1 Tax=Zychaea mexicana TaxID=64656 RepID=UPI0022FEFE12|nr:uncharacterized protein BDB00DRAFT_855668 [Zychaea mexicana]KAI9484429.1 hypothetical protein BDB00DRAFT_855668 [Zychaea mexicana]